MQILRRRCGTLRKHSSDRVTPPDRSRALHDNLDVRARAQREVDGEGGGHVRFDVLLPALRPRRVGRSGVRGQGKF